MLASRPFRIPLRPFALQARSPISSRCTWGKKACCLLTLTHGEVFGKALGDFGSPLRQCFRIMCPTVDLVVGVLDCLDD